MKPLSLPASTSIFTHPNSYYNKTLPLPPQKEVQRITKLPRKKKPPFFLSLKWKITNTLIRNVWPDFQGEHECRNFEQIRKWVLSPARFLRFPNTFVNPYFGPNGQQTTPIPSSIEGSTELVSGTRLNPKVMKLAGGEPY